MFSEYDDLKYLFVSDEYYYIYNSKQILSCFSREDGALVSSKELNSDHFTFCNGYFVYLDGDKGDQKIYFTPAADLNKSTLYFSLDLEPDKTFEKIYYGGENCFYVWGRDNSANYIKKFDRSKDAYNGGYCGGLKLDEDIVGHILRLNVMENDDDIYFIREKNNSYFISKISFSSGERSDIFQIPPNVKGDSIYGIAFCEKRGIPIIAIRIEDKVYNFDKNTGKLLDDANIFDVE